MTNFFRNSLDNIRSDKGIYAAFLSAIFLGLSPIFGKQAINLGFTPVAVVAIRTTFATLFLLLIMLIFFRKYFFIYPAGLLGCFLAGFMNGIGSLFYYSALGRLEAGLGQLLYSLYPLFLLIWTALYHQPPGRLTLIRIIVAIPSIFLITRVGMMTVDWIGVSQMLIASALYAFHIPINQRVLYDMPAQTVTLYTLIAMSAVVFTYFIISGPTFVYESTQTGNVATSTHLISMSYKNLHIHIKNLFREGGPIIALALVTFLSRFTLFMGVKHLGGMQTALLGLGELIVTVIFAQLWLNERFSTTQWIGAILLGANLSLISVEKNLKVRQISNGFLSWLVVPGFRTKTWRMHD